METNKYQSGKIYKVIDNSYTQCYIGSTTEGLSLRMTRHRDDYRKWKNGNRERVCSIASLFDEFGVENCKIELVEDFPCENREQLRKREGYHIQNTECINKNIAGRTLKEWKQDHKEAQAEYNASYRQEHREKVLQGMREWRQKNIERKRAYERERVTCTICSVTFVRSHRPAHNRTAKHKHAAHSHTDSLEQQI